MPTFDSWRSMQAWQPASATLTDVTSASSRTEARYQYRVNGADYENDRVYVASSNDSIGSYQKDLQTRLTQSLRSGRAIEIWYNPRRPQESVIDRDMRWGLFTLMSVFSTVFLLTGLTVCYFSMTWNEEDDDKVAIHVGHGLFSTGSTVDEAAWWFVSMGKACPCRLQLLASAAGDYEVWPDDAAAAIGAALGSPMFGWLSFQTLWDEIVEEYSDLLTAV